MDICTYILSCILLYICLSSILFIFNLSAHLYSSVYFIWVFIYLFYLSVNLSILSVCLIIYNLFIYLFIYSSVYSIWVFICSLYLSVHLYFELYIKLYLCLSVCLSDQNSWTPGPIGLKFWLRNSGGPQECSWFGFKITS